jgi:hypothetical protein
MLFDLKHTLHSNLSSSATELSSLPLGHPLAVVDWTTFANVSVSKTFPPAVAKKVQSLHLSHIDVDVYIYMYIYVYVYVDVDVYVYVCV